MINVKVSGETECKYDYPKLMKSDRGLIVLFLKDDVGTVVSPDKFHDCGEFRDDWFMPDFVDYKGEVTLSNGSKK